MTIRRRRSPTFPEDDIRHGAPPRKARNIGNTDVTAQLDEDHDASTSGLSHSSFIHNKTAKTDREAKLSTTDKGDAESNSDTCAICLMKRTDPTLLDSCDHSFCYFCASQWLKHAGKCPLCMTEVKTFWHNLHLPINERTKVSVVELRAAAEAARLAERGRSLPPHDEQECVRLRIRRLQRRLRRVQEQMNNTTKVDRSSELATANVRLVNEITKLDMLKRDATTRSELVSNILFRSLIYKELLDWSSIDRNANRIPFSPEVFSANINVISDRLRNFLHRELKIVWRNKKPCESLDQYEMKREHVVSEIISWCLELQINSPGFTRNLRLAGIYPSYLERFQSELFEFASSMVSLEDFDSMSAYSSRELRQLLRRRNRFAEQSQEIVMLSETDSDSAVIPLDGVRYYAFNNRTSDDIIVLSDNNRSGEESISAQNQTNFVRDEAASTTSENSSHGDFYTRPACLLLQPVPTLIHVVDSFGYSRDILPRSSRKPVPSLDSSDVVFVAASNDHTQCASSSANIIDNTIVISSDDEGAITSTTSTNTHRLNVGSSQMPSTSLFSSKKTSAKVISWLESKNEEQPEIGEYQHGVDICSGNTLCHKTPRDSSQSSQDSNLLASQIAVVCVTNCVDSTNKVDASKSSQNLLGRAEPTESISPISSAGYYETPVSSNNPSTGYGLVKDCAAAQSSTSQLEVPSETRVATKSLFRPVDKNTLPIPNDSKGKNGLLASLWKERQQRCDAPLGFRSINPMSTPEMQHDEENKEENCGIAENFAEDQMSRNHEQENLSKCSTNFTGTRSASSPVGGMDPPCQSSWETTDTTGTSTQWVQRSLSKYAQTSSDLKRQDTKCGNRNHSKLRKKRQRKKLSWRFLFKQFRRKLRHEKSPRKHERLYEFIEEMKRKLDKKKRIGKLEADNPHDGHSSQDSFRMSPVISAGHEH